jgi:Resolvase, N terminal domain/Recombinase
MEAGVDFVACDNPHATRLTIHILAAVAEHEREMISERTKAALAAAKARGVKLGGAGLAEARSRSLAARREQRPPPEILQLMAGLAAQGVSRREIARRLNGLGLRTARGKIWYSATVMKALNCGAEAGSSEQRFAIGSGSTAELTRIELLSRQVAIANHTPAFGYAGPPPSRTSQARRRAVNSATDGNNPGRVDP